MTDSEANPPQDNPQGGGGKPDDDNLIKGRVRHNQLSARVPESVAGGVFSTGAIVLVGANEFILDFVVRMARPHQVAARVILPHAVMPQLIQALKTNLEKFSERFGTPPEMPKGDPGSRKPSIEEVYDDLKMPDETLSGAYANAVMISHSPAEFCFDFITNFFPKSSVSCRIFVSANQVPRMLEAFTHTNQEFQKRAIAQTRLRRPQLPPQEPADQSSPYYPPRNQGPSDDNQQIIGPSDMQTPPEASEPPEPPESPESPDSDSSENDDAPNK
jgi:hypothetical protein